MSRYSCFNRRKGGGKTVIAMYTYKDNLTPLLYSGKKKKKRMKYLGMNLNKEVKDQKAQNIDEGN